MRNYTKLTNQWISFFKKYLMIGNIENAREAFTSTKGLTEQDWKGISKRLDVLLRDAYV